MKKIDRYTISKWSENIDSISWCKDEDVAKLEVENEKLQELLFSEWCNYRGIHPNKLSDKANQLNIEIFNEWFKQKLEE